MHTYSYDLVGNRTKKQIDQTRNGTIDETITYSYDKNGALIRKETAPTNDLNNPTEEIDYDYNLQGRLKQVEFTDASGTTTTVYSLYSAGEAIKCSGDAGADGDDEDTGP